MPIAFADDQLGKMAGYRNRMAHFYAEISEKELYEIIQNDLADFQVFCRHIHELLSDPSKAGLTLE